MIGMITLVGVGHVFDIQRQIRDLILQKNPSLVCIELDKARYSALLNKKLRKGSAPIQYKMLAAFQSWIARKYGTRVGDEMIAAVNTAKEIGIDVAFIDMEASMLFEKIWNMMSFNERMKILIAGFAGFFTRKKRIEMELKRFEKDSDHYIDIFAKEFPTIKRILIDDRDKHMANMIRRLNAKYENIVAVVGDGHIQGMKNMLGDLNLEIVRLSELRTGKTMKPAGGEGVTVTYSYKLD